MKKLPQKGREKIFDIAFLLVPKFNISALTITIEPLRIANYTSTEQLYTWRLISADGESVMADNGMMVSVDGSIHDDHPIDMVLVCASWNADHYSDKSVFAWLHKMDQLNVPLGAMCLGTYLLAYAKLLDGHQVTLHWASIPSFSEQFPKLEVQQSLYVIDGNRITIAGGTAGADLMLHIIEKDHGRKLALDIADLLLYPRARPAETPQRLSYGGFNSIIDERLRTIIEIIEDNIEKPLAIPELAVRVDYSQRQLERLFKRELGCSPSKYYKMTRLEHARVMLRQTTRSVIEISVACGFTDASQFANSYKSQFGITPHNDRDAQAKYADWHKIPC